MVSTGRTRHAFGISWLVAAFLSGSTVGVASATGGSHGWTDCNWAWRENSTNPSIFIQDDGTFPANSNGDGVVNSFQNRINGSIATWSSAMAGLGLRGRLVRVSSGAQVVIHNQSYGSPTGATVITTPSGAYECVVHRATGRNVLFADIYMTVRPDWFTQNNDRRALWENCPYNGLQPAYTCSKKHDFESSLTHEIGHAIGAIWHPNQVDIHAGNQNATFNAECTRRDANGDPLWRATMCPSDSATGQLSSNEYRTERRGLHAWDIESFRELHSRH